MNLLTYLLKSARSWALIVALIVAANYAPAAPAPASEGLSGRASEDWTTSTAIARSSSGSLYVNELWWYLFLTRETPTDTLDKFVGARQGVMMLKSDCLEWRLALVPAIRRLAAHLDKYSEWKGSAQDDEKISLEKRAQRLLLRRAHEQWQASALARIARQHSMDELSSTASLASPEKVRRETRTVQYILIPRTQLEDDEKTSRTLTEVMEKLEAGEDFGQLAREYSAASTARIGGIREHVTSASLPEGTADAMFSASVDDPPAIVETDYAFFIYRVLNSTLQEGTPDRSISTVNEQETAAATDITLAEDASRLQRKHGVKVNLPDRVTSETDVVRWPDGELLASDVAELFPELWTLDRTEATDQAACAVAAWLDLGAVRGDRVRPLEVAQAVVLEEYLASQHLDEGELRELYASLSGGTSLQETTGVRIWQCRVVLDLPTTITAGDIYFLRQQQPEVATSVAAQLEALDPAERAERAKELEIPASFRIDVEDLGYREDASGLLMGNDEPGPISEPRPEAGQSYVMYWATDVRPARTLSFDESRSRLEQVARQRRDTTEAVSNVRIASDLFPCEEAVVDEGSQTDNLSEEEVATTSTSDLLKVTSGNLQMKIRIRNQREDR